MSCIYSFQKSLDFIEQNLNHEINFVRAFGKEYGISPSAYRKSRYSLAFFGRIDLGQKDIVKLYSGIRIEPKLVLKESFMVAGFSIKTTWQDSRHLKDISVFWNRYYAERPWERISDMTKEAFRTDYGVSFDYGVYEESFGWNGSFEWLGGVKVDSLENLPAGMTGKLIPAAEYAVFTTPVSNAESIIENIKLTWKYIT